MAFGFKKKSKEEAPADSVRQVTEESELLEVLGEGTAVLYKHSNRCGLCYRSIKEVQKFSREHPDVDVLLIEVVDSRPLSNLIEERLGVFHQSPQAIVVRDGEAVWEASHLAVTAGGISRAIA